MNFNTIHSFSKIEIPNTISESSTTKENEKTLQHREAVGNDAIASDRIEQLSILRLEFDKNPQMDFDEFEKLRAACQLTGSIHTEMNPDLVMGGEAGSMAREFGIITPIRNTLDFLSTPITDKDFFNFRCESMKDALHNQTGCFAWQMTQLDKATTETQNLIAQASNGNFSKFPRTSNPSHIAFTKINEAFKILSAQVKNSKNKEHLEKLVHTSEFFENINLTKVIQAGAELNYAQNSASSIGQFTALRSIQKAFNAISTSKGSDDIADKLKNLINIFTKAQPQLHAYFSNIENNTKQEAATEHSKYDDIISQFKKTTVTAKEKLDKLTQQSKESKEGRNQTEDDTLDIFG